MENNQPKCATSKSGETRTVKFKNSKEMDMLLDQYSKILSASGAIGEMTDVLEDMLLECLEEMVKVRESSDSE